MTNPPLEPIYRQYYKQQWLTPKQMANLICGNDPRGRSLKFTDSDFKNTLQRIIDAVIRGDLTSKDDTHLNDSEINSHDLFVWASDNFPDFRTKLPVDLITRTGGGQMELSAMTGQSFALDLPTDYQLLRQAYIELYLENIELKSRLSIFEHENPAKTRGGNASKGKAKE